MTSVWLWKNKNPVLVGVFEHSVILCPEVRRVTCAESCPVPRATTPRAPWRWLFPPTPPFPWALSENLTCKSCLSKQVGGLIVKQWHCFCPLAGLPICCINYITVKSGGAASFQHPPACLWLATPSLSLALQFVPLLSARWTPRDAEISLTSSNTRPPASPLCIWLST